MKRNKNTSKNSIILMAKHLESGDTFYKIDSGSVTHALIEARYWIEYGMSKDDYIKKTREKRYKEAVLFFEKLKQA